MPLPRLIYFTALLGCGVFWLAYTQWISQILLTVVLLLPWLSLLLSLPAMVKFQAVPAGPEHILAGSHGLLWLVGSCRLPVPPFRGALRLRNSFTGEVVRYNDDKGIPSHHSGSYHITVHKGRVYDYLGLFSLPIPDPGSKCLRILPKPIAVTDLPGLPQLQIRRSTPSSPELYELRPFRPGDRLNQIHWKLSAKTGQLILREPTDPITPQILLTMTLHGTPEELDRMLGRFVWLGKYLLQMQLPFVLQVLTGNGCTSFSIRDPQSLQQVLDGLLIATPAPKTCVWLPTGNGLWHYHIGGAAHQ